MRNGIEYSGTSDPSRLRLAAFSHHDPSMANSGLQQSRWYFTKERLEDSPSRRCGIDAEKELSNRQQAANLIQDMGQRLNV